MAARSAADEPDLRSNGRPRRSPRAAQPPRLPLAARLARASRRRSIRMAPADEHDAVKAAELFTAYLARCRGRRCLALHSAARPVSHAGRSRRLAAPHLRAARSRRRTRTFARARSRALMAAALRFLCREGGEAVLLRPFRPARPPDRAGRCACARSMPAPTPCAICATR